MDINSLSFFIFAFSSLFTLVNPIGILPVILSLTKDIDQKEYNQIIFRACFVALIILMIFAILGEWIFSFYGITVHAFKIAGGILFLRIGINMLEAKISRTKSTPKEEEEASSIEDIALSPIGIPIIAGPGALSSVMLLGTEASNQKHKIIFYLTILITLLITCFILYIGKKFSKKLGTTGLRVIQRIMGLLLMVIAVQFIIDGINNVAIEFINSNF